MTGTVWEAATYFPALSSTRLRLREVHPEDAAALYAIHSDAHHMRYMGKDPMRHIDEAHSLVQRFVSDRSLPTPALRWAIERQGQPGLIGTCGFFNWSQHWKRCVLGYELSPHATGQGYMSEAVASIIRFGFQHLGLNRVEAIIHPQHADSIRLVNGLGFVHEALLREVAFWDNQHHDMLQFALLRRDWRDEQESEPCAE